MTQDEIIDRVAEVLAADDRVLGLWLTGSRARGTHDEYSDVDFVAAAAEPDFDEFVTDWPEISQGVCPLVLRQQLGQAPIFNHITPEWVRYDLTVETPDDFITRSQTTTLPLFDKADLTATMRPFGDPLTPNARDIERLTTEFLRVLGLLPVVIGRGEHVVGMSGAGLLRSLLIQLMLKDVAVEDRGGALRLAGVLPYDRLEELAALPAFNASRESVVNAHVACADLFLPLARDLTERTGATWPAEFERATRSRLRDTLSLDI